MTNTTNAQTTKNALTSQQRWAELVRSFPTLQRWASGADLRNADDLLEALGVVYCWIDEGYRPCESAAWLTSGSRFALLFCLDVWNSGMRELLPESLQRWSSVTAFSIWDHEHRAAALAYYQEPFYP